MATPEISIILPIYNERESIGALLAEIRVAMDAFGRSYEIVAVDDGSRDGTADLLRELSANDPRVRLVRFGRNHGQAAAFDAGFCRATAPLIVTLDADGQNDPADIPRLVRHMEEGQLDFVSGRRAQRKDHAVRRKLPSKIANWLIRTVTRTRITDLGCSLKVYRASIVKEVRLYGEMHRFLAVMIEGAGARVGEIDVNHRPRLAGVSKYGLSRTLKVMVDLLTVWFMHGFSTSPIYLFGSVAGLLGVGAVATSGYVLLDKFLHGVFVHRNPLFILSMVMAIMSVQFLALGVIAEVLIRTYFEARGKPAYLVFEDTADRTAPTIKLEATTYVSQRNPALTEAG